MGTQAPVGEAADGMDAGAQRADQGHDPRVAEPQGWGPLTGLDGRSRDPLKGCARKDTALADTESVDHPAVDVTPAGDELIEVFDPPGDPEITGVVDHGLDPERSAFLQVAFHPRVPEVGVEGDLIARTQQPGPVTP